MIPGVPRVHPRTEWEQDGYRMATDFTRTPTPMTMGKVTTMVAHYTGAKNVPSGDPGENLTQFRDYLRSIERDYMQNRTGGGYTRKSDGRYFPGYHTGYSFAVDWTGGVWEIRGFSFLPAATNEHNDYTVAVLFFVDGPDQANDVMWASARAIGREARRLSGRTEFDPQFTDHGTLTITSGHGTATACAGPGIRGQLATEGNIDEGTTPPIPGPNPPVPGPPSTAEDDEMLVVALDANGSAWVGNGIHRLLINSDSVFQRYILVHGDRFVNTSGQVVKGWNNVGTADNDTLAALGFA